jgi:hypothetical protein
MQIKTIIGVGVAIIGVIIGIANFLTHYIVHT